MRDTTDTKSVWNWFRLLRTIIGWFKNSCIIDPTARMFSNGPEGPFFLFRGRLKGIPAHSAQREVVYWIQNRNKGE